MAALVEILRLIGSYRERRAIRGSPFLDELFRRLARCPPAEAWHKRAVLYYLLGRDEESLRDLRRTLELEPRHFGAMLHFAEILRAASAAAEASYTVRAARSIHPHLTIPDSGGQGGETAQL